MTIQAWWRIIVACPRCLVLPVQAAKQETAHKAHARRSTAHRTRGKALPRAPNPLGVSQSMSAPQEAEKLQKIQAKYEELSRLLRLEDVPAIDIVTLRKWQEKEVGGLFVPACSAKVSPSKLISLTCPLRLGEAGREARPRRREDEGGVRGLDAARGALVRSNFGADSPEEKPPVPGASHSPLPRVQARRVRARLGAIHRA